MDFWVVEQELKLEIIKFNDYKLRFTWMMRACLISSMRRSRSDSKKSRSAISSFCSSSANAPMSV